MPTVRDPVGSSSGMKIVRTSWGRSSPSQTETSSGSPERRESRTRLALAGHLPQASDGAASVLGALEDGHDGPVAVDARRRRPRARAGPVPGVEHHRQLDPVLGSTLRQLRGTGRAEVRDEAVPAPVTPLVRDRVAGPVLLAPSEPVIGDPGAAQDGDAERRPQGVVAAGPLDGAGEAPPRRGVEEVDPVDHGLLVAGARPLDRPEGGAGHAQRPGPAPAGTTNLSTRWASCQSTSRHTSTELSPS